MSSTYLPQGIHVPLVTPFEQDGSVALAALEGLAHRMLDAGAAGLVALGTTGEPATLEPAERDAVVDVCASVCRERGADLMVGVSTNSTAAATAAAGTVGARAGVTSLLSTAPYFTRPSEAGAVLHLQAIAEASPVPLVVYNVPYRTARTLSAASVLELAATPNVAGVKHAVGGIDQDTVDLLAAAPEGFSVLAGDDVFLYSVLALGGSGGIMASAHLRTADFVRVCELAAKGDLPGARSAARPLLALSSALFAEPNPSVIKGVLHAQGHIPTPAVRLPLTPASTAAVEAALVAEAEAEAAAQR